MQLLCRRLVAIGPEHLHILGVQQRRAGERGFETFDRTRRITARLFDAVRRVAERMAAHQTRRTRARLSDVRATSLRHARS